MLVSRHEAGTRKAEALVYSAHKICWETKIEKCGGLQFRRRYKNRVEGEADSMKDGDAEAVESSRLRFKGVQNKYGRLSHSISAFFLGNEHLLEIKCLFNLSASSTSSKSLLTSEVIFSLQGIFLLRSGGSPSASFPSRPFCLPKYK